MRINPDNKKIRYSGRIDWRNPKEPIWVYPCTSAEFKFTGKYLKIFLKNKNEYWQNYLGCILDGVQLCYYLDNKKENEIEIRVPENENGEHHVLFFKRQDSCHEMHILGFEIEDGAKLLELPDAQTRKIEVYGDSVSAGEVTEAVDYTGKTDPEHQGGYSNSWYSYAWMTARKLGAELHDTSQGGIALLDGTGWFGAPAYYGVESCYDKLAYNPDLGEVKKWDFSRYTPQVVVVAIGQNDNHPVDYMASDPECSAAEHWRKRYREFIETLMKRYPKAQIILTTTILKHQPNWDASIGTVCGQIASERVHHFLYRRNGSGTPGHIRIPEAEEMSEELASYIRSLGDKIWDV